MWINTNKIIIKGKMKCSLKNRIKVDFLTENPPHIQYVREFPI